MTQAPWPHGEPDRLDRFAADSRIDEAIRSRSRERWLRQQVAEGATFAGLCWDIAERGAPVRMTTILGDVHRGPIAAVGEDFLSLWAPRAELLLPYGAVATISTTAGAAGDRTPRRAARLADALGTLAGDRPLVTARLGPHTMISGELHQAGVDVVGIVPDDGRRQLVYARLSSLVELSLIVSG